MSEGRYLCTCTETDPVRCTKSWGGKKPCTCPCHGMSIHSHSPVQRLKDLRENFLEVQQALLTAEGETFSLPIAGGGKFNVKWLDLVALICLAKFDDELVDTVTYGEWTTIGKSFHHRLLEGENGHRFVLVPIPAHAAEKEAGTARWVSADGRQAFGPGENLPHSLRVREVHLPSPRPVPIPQTLDERAWALLERVSCMLGGRDYADAQRLLDEKAKS